MENSPFHTPANGKQLLRLVPLAVLLALAFAPTRAAYAQNITVTTLADVQNNDGIFSLREAIVNAVLVESPADGTLTLNEDGSFTYIPDADLNGPDSFTYKANDGALDSNVATVAITVNAVNDAPVAGRIAVQI